MFKQQVFALVTSVCIITSFAACCKKQCQVKEAPIVHIEELEDIQVPEIKTQKEMVTLN